MVRTWTQATTALAFPLPPFRQRLLEAHLAHSAQEAKGPGQVQLRHKTDEETVYSEHKWNINNMPRCKVRLPHIFLYTDEDFASHGTGTAEERPFLLSA